MEKNRLEKAIYDAQWRADKGKKLQALGYEELLTKRDEFEEWLASHPGHELHNNIKWLLTQSEYRLEFLSKNFTKEEQKIWQD